MEMLQLNDLHKTFNPGTVNEKVALNGVSLQMEAGDFATIVGSNGAGKSTLFNAITGGFIADEGSILLGGQDITFAPEHQRSKVIGHLFQDPLKGTAPNMTIEENLALAYLRAGVLYCIRRNERENNRGGEPRYPVQILRRIPRRCKEQIFLDNFPCRLARLP